MDQPLEIVKSKNKNTGRNRINKTTTIEHIKEKIHEVIHEMVSNFKEKIQEIDLVFSYDPNVRNEALDVLYEYLSDLNEPCFIGMNECIESIRKTLIESRQKLTLKQKQAIQEQVINS